MAAGSISYEDFEKAASYFIELSDRLGDSWQLQGTTEIYLSKTTKMTLFDHILTKADTQAQQQSFEETECVETAVFAGPQQRHLAEATESAGIEPSHTEIDELPHVIQDVDTLSGPQTKTVLYTFDFHIVYGRSYSVPVLYFNVYTPDGALLPLDDLWTSIPVHYRQSLDRWTTLTQQEHPHLGRPFFQLHPCHTEQLMTKTLANCDSCLRRYLVCWLSSVGPLVHLSLPLTYFTSC